MVNWGYNPFASLWCPASLLFVATRLWGGKVFGLGVIRPQSHIHGIDEYVVESDMEQLVEVLVRFLTRTQKEAA